MSSLLTEQLMKEFAEDIVAGIKQDYATKKVTPYGPMIASGLTAESIFIRFDSVLMELKIGVSGKAAEYVEQLESGIPPGTVARIEDLVEWTIVKGIPVEPGVRVRGERAGEPYTELEARTSLAFAIRHKIKEEGSVLHRLGGNSGILTGHINRENILRLRSRLILAVMQEFKSEVLPKPKVA